MRACLQPSPDIVYNENFRELALGLDRKAIDRTQPSEERNRALATAERKLIAELWANVAEQLGTALF